MRTQKSDWTKEQVWNIAKFVYIRMLMKLISRRLRSYFRGNGTRNKQIIRDKLVMCICVKMPNVHRAPVKWHTICNPFLEARLSLVFQENRMPIIKIIYSTDKNRSRKCFFFIIIISDIKNVILRIYITYLAFNKKTFLLRHIQFPFSYLQLVL